MSTINVSLSETLRAFVEEQVADLGYDASGEYVRDLIRKDRDRRTMRRLLNDGLNSPATIQADRIYFDALRERVRAYEE